MPMFRKLLSRICKPDRSAAAALVSKLPAYQVAFWPDGWDLEPGGGVLVRDTHAMAEARRWFALADRNGSRDDGRRVMSVHGVFVPRAIVDLADRRFASEEVASVAVQLIAGEWIAERRRRLLRSPERTFSERSLSWRGSRYKPDLDGQGVRALVEGLIRMAVYGGFIPDLDYRVLVHTVDGYGVVAYRCLVTAALDQDAAGEVLDVLGAALVPWNRVLIRDAVAVPWIGLELGSIQGAHQAEHFTVAMRGRR